MASANINVPQHIAIIMDGNGRWAQSRFMPRIAGHKRGVNALHECIEGCVELGIKNLTVFAFSTENWNRPKEEVEFLFDYIRKNIKAKTAEFVENKISVKFIGDLDSLPGSVTEELLLCESQTKGGESLNLNVALNYGGRWDILNAVKQIASDSVAHSINPNDLTEEMFGEYLCNASLPDPDLLIRTSGEQRISNFLLWQTAYSELYFSNVLWPDFNKAELNKAVEEYSRRSRRYGAL